MLLQLILTETRVYEKIVFMLGHGYGYCLKHIFRDSERESLKSLIVRWRIMYGLCIKNT
jgi:hypothetical protein